MRTERLHEVMAGHVEAGSVPGLVTLLARGDEVHVDAIGHTGYGVTDPMRRDTIFRITSMTKPITATAVLLLVQDGVLGLDGPVDGWLPELADRRVLADPAGPLDDTVPARRPITVRDLLTFCWGLGMDVEPPADAPVQRAIAELGLGVGPPVPPVAHTPDEWMRRLGTLPLMHQPGARWIYHVGSDVLGVLVARAAGVDLGSFLRARVFEPLGMADTGFAVPAAQRHRLPPLHGGEHRVLDAPDGAWSAPPVFPSGGSGLVSTADDYLAFARMLLAGGGGLLHPESVALMTTDHVTPAQRGSVFLDGRGWGLGLSVYDSPAGGATIGWEGGGGSVWFSEPARGTTALLLTQRMFTAESWALVEGFGAAAREALLEP